MADDYEETITTEQARAIRRKIYEMGHFPPSMVQIQRVIETAEELGLVEIPTGEG